jgi:LytS/YehU family sensor histidine kinase
MKDGRSAMAGAARRGSGAGSGLLNIVREIGDITATLWWRFFDWLAQVEWRKLMIIWLLVLIFGLTPFGHPEQTGAFIMLSFGLKVLAGGKRKAELEARDATSHADEEGLERRLVEARMAALQAQVEPHFLFNTLALIGQLIETDPPQAARIHQNLIDYLRATLPQMRARGAGTLGRQIEMSRAYLAIMQARMRSRLAVSIDVPPEMLSATFPVMMLQILIENAIKHGLEPKIDGGRIDIRASVDGPMLQVDVIDDGIGFNVHAGDGLGLSNVRERLRILYGARAQLVIEAPLTGGTRAGIRLPYAPDIFAATAP